MKNKTILLGFTMSILLLIPLIEESNAKLRGATQVSLVLVNGVPVTKSNAIFHTDSDNTIKVKISTTEMLNVCLFGFENPRPMQCVPEKIHPGINNEATWIVKVDPAEHKIFHLEITSPDSPAKTLTYVVPVNSP